MVIHTRKRYDSIQCVISNTDIELQNNKQAFRSELLLNVYSIHLWKVSGADTEWGEPIGALTLCTTAVCFFFLFLLLYLSKHIHFHYPERARSFWMSSKNMSKKMDNGKPKF